MSCAWITSYGLWPRHRHLLFCEGTVHRLSSAACHSGTLLPPVSESAEKWKLSDRNRWQLYSEVTGNFGPN